MWLRRVASDFWFFLKHYKAWWITPIVVILVLVGVLAAFTDDPQVVPFIYTVK
jgi:hypothetical protein